MRSSRRGELSLRRRTRRLGSSKASRVGWHAARRGTLQRTARAHAELDARIEGARGARLGRTAQSSARTARTLRQVLLPTIAVQEEKSTDSVVRTMRLGVVDAILPPFTKPKFRALLRYVLKAVDQRFLACCRLAHRFRHARCMNRAIIFMSSSNDVGGKETHHRGNRAACVCTCA